MREGEVQSTEEIRDPRTMVALSERVAIVETKVGSLKEDTGVIRASIHGINNEIQKIVATEQRCAAALEAMQATMLDRGGQVKRIETTLESLLQSRSMAEGALAATFRITSAVTASIGVLALILGGLAWALGHVALK